MKPPADPTSPVALIRRQMLRQVLRRGVALGAMAALPSLSLPAHARVPARQLAMHHLHTREHIELAFAQGDRYFPEALGTLDRFLRDHYSGEVGRIDPRLHDLLHAVRQVLGTDRPFQVISGFRAPRTNARLKATRGGGVASRSLHMDGMAIDVRLEGVALTDLRDAALSLRAGGVGFYPGEQFVHLDTGRVRRW